jgi:hypothetical protein
MTDRVANTSEELDRGKLIIAQEKIQLHLRRLPVGCAEVTESHVAERNSHNLNVYTAGRYVGVIDIESRKNDLKWYEESGKMVVSTERLSRLKRYFYRKQAGVWSKDVCLAWITGDDAVLLINVEEIIAHWGELVRWPKGGKILPVAQMIIL